MKSLRDNTAKKKYISIKEYDYIFCDDSLKNYDLSTDDNGNIGVSGEVFHVLEDFVLRNKIKDEEDITDIMTLDYKKGVGKIIKAKNYVGTIVFNNGLIIEILPKIYTFQDHKDRHASDGDIKKLVIEMIRTLKNSSFKKLNFAKLKTYKMPLFEVFINMFLDELELLVKKGLKSDYVTISENKNVLKGKLMLPQHLYYNFAHKERFYVQYDEYLKDRAENRIIKTTLVLLFQIPKSSYTQKRIYRFLSEFDKVSISVNVDTDLAKCKIDRTMKHYETILEWCKLFLKKQSFTNYKGTGNALAILFPMEKLFEGYIAHAIKKSSIFEEYMIYTQHKRYYLIEEPRMFLLKPDIVLQHIQKPEVIVMDTKWKKLINDERKNYGISQSDIYQMYAYGKKYNAKKVVLIFPVNEEIYHKREIRFKYSTYGDKELELIIFLVDLFELVGIDKSTTNSMECLLDSLYKLIK
ncbi:MAG: McrC family protein [Thermosipho sp. (in: Bacteria)]|nr:McrC family protein [Thermosipho sp. (in: thermotogales)]